MATKALNMPYDTEKYFDITLQTNTPNYYTLECTLVNQMAYLVGEDVLFDSTLNANDNFKNEYISITSKEEFLNIQANIDKLTEMQGKLALYYEKLDSDKVDEAFAEKLTKEIENSKEQIKELFINTQKLILTSYFDNAINLAYKPKLLENYRNKLYIFKDKIGYVEGDNFYNEYYVSKMQKLEERYELDFTGEKSLTVVKKSLWRRFINKIKMLFGLESEFEN